MNSESLNKRIARLRKAKGLKQADMAERLGLKESTYSQMERQGNITAQKLLDIAAILGVDVNVLLYGEDYLEPSKNNGGSTINFEQKAVVLEFSDDPPKPVTKFDVAVEAFRNLKKDQQDEVYVLIQKFVDENRSK